MPEFDAGTFREEVCPSHKHIEWQVSYEPLLEHGLGSSSPVFKIGKASYSLEVIPFHAKSKTILLWLRAGPRDNERFLKCRYWSGLKCSDGSYSHSYTSDKISQNKEDSWKVASLMSIPFSESLISEGCLTFFFRMNVEAVLAERKKCIHGPPPVPTPSSGGIRQERCCTHTHVEWDIGCVANPENDLNLTSDGFQIGPQTYFFEARFLRSGDVTLRLYSIGTPSQDPPDARCWLGLKNSDGSYPRQTSTGFLDLREDLGLWTEVRFNLTYSKKDIEELYLTSDGLLVFFFRLNVGSASVETCLHDRPPYPGKPWGSIRVEDCSTHKHVEWDVDYVSPTETDLRRTSPIFEIGSHAHFFESCYEVSGSISLYLYRLGTPVEFSERYWIGMRHGDGSYDFKIVSEVLDLKEDFGLWTLTDSTWFITKEDFQEGYLSSDGRLTFFYRIAVHSTDEQTCSHGFPQISPTPSGRILEETCSSHKHVEWILDRPLLLKKKICLRSSVFEIGNQAFFLCLYNVVRDKISFILFRLGCSASRTVRLWAGLKLPDGTCPLRYYSSKKIDLAEKLSFWTMVASFNDISVEDFEKHWTSDLRLWIFFRMNSGTTGDDTCMHGISAIPSEISGSIRAEGGSSHKHVEWDIVNQDLAKKNISLASPVFQIGSQLYFLALITHRENYMSYSVYRLGRSVPSSFRWWAGRKYSAGPYPAWNFSGELALREDLDWWTEVSEEMRFDVSSPSKFRLESDGLLTLFFRMNMEAIGRETCNHDLTDMYASEFVGSILETYCPTHKHVEWCLAHEPSPLAQLHRTSPVFEVENKKYQLHLICHKNGFVELGLYRIGFYVENPTLSTRCWAGLKRADGTHHHRMKVAKLDLGQECSMWAQMVSVPLSHSSDLERIHLTPDGNLTVFLQMDGARYGDDVVACTHGALQMCAPGVGTIRQRNGQLVEWDVAFEEPSDHAHLSTSPAFTISDQCYLLELFYEVGDNVTLSIYRSGRASSARCWAGLCSDGWNYRRDIEGTYLDLEENSELWTKAAVLLSFKRSDLEKLNAVLDGRLTFFLLVESSSSTDVAEEQKDGPMGAEIRSKTEYEDRLRRDFKLWLQHPEEAERIRRLRRAEKEVRQQRYRVGPTEEDQKLSIYAA